MLGLIASFNLDVYSIGNLMLHFTLITMVYCVAFGCKNRLTKGCDIHFFQFPKDVPRRRKWIHYCRRADFTEATPSSTLCSKHFSSDQFERDPLKLAQFGYKNARPKLKNDAVPDIHINVEEAISQSRKRPADAKLNRRACEKRRRAEMSGAATLPKFNSLPWSTVTWNDCVRSSKSALRWDIKNSMKSLCKRLTEVGEECFIVTVNMKNGWVGHIGSTKGDEYIEDRPQIPWDFLEYCRDSDYVTSSSNISSDSEESNGDDDTENTESCESEDWEPPDKDNDTWEPNKPLCPDQSDRSLRSHDLQKVTHATCADTTAGLEMDISENSQKKTKTSNIPNNGRRNCIQKIKQPAVKQSPLKRRSSYVSPRRKSRNEQKSLQEEKLKLNLNFITKSKKMEKKKRQLKQCVQCCQVFKHEKLYKKHVESHRKGKSKDGMHRCHKCKRKFGTKRVLYSHIPVCGKT